VKGLVTGGTGFIGSHLVDRMIEREDEVIVYDNLSKTNPHINPKSEFVKGDLLDLGLLKDKMKGVEFVFHFAANADIARGMIETDLDLKNNVIGTYNVLEAMRINNVKKILFASSSTVYGETKIMPTPESHPLQPISLYGASKVAGEALIRAFSDMFDMQAWILRFGNIVGSRHTRGVTHDFIKKLKMNKDKLEVLGDGNQTKSYLLVDELIDAMLLATEKSRDKINIYNIGNDTTITVKEIANIVSRVLGLNPTIKYGDKDRGWIGDVPHCLLDITKIKKLGWKPKKTSAETIEANTHFLKDEVV